MVVGQHGAERGEGEQRAALPEQPRGRTVFGAGTSTDVLTPSVAVTYRLRSFAKYKLLRSLKAARIPCPLFAAISMMPLTPS